MLQPQGNEALQSSQGGVSLCQEVLRASKPEQLARLEDEKIQSSVARPIYCLIVKTAMLLNYQMTPGNMHLVEVGRKVLARDSIISEGSVLLVYSQPTDALHKHIGQTYPSGKNGGDDNVLL